MRIAVDCEFNGFGGQLISMALVAEDGREWYAELPEPRIWNEWCFDNVFPHLELKPIERGEFRQQFRAFLEQFDDITIVADWYTDLVHFFDTFAGKDHTESFHIPCHAVLLPDMEFQPSATPHNALADARAIMETLKRLPVSTPTNPDNGAQA
jgi:hypothetical protein